MIDFAALLLAGGILATPCPPQEGAGSGASNPPTGSRSTALHRAWLLEVLDLDPAAAARRYRAIAADDRPGHFTRWVAAARLAELQHLDVAHGPPPDLRGLPNVLRPYFDELDDTRDLSALLRKVEGPPVDVLRSLGTEEGQLPPLRPLVPVAAGWVAEQTGPNRLDRIDRSRRRRRLDRGRAHAVDLWHAMRILQAELEGLRAKADGRRSLHFLQWQPPDLDAGDAEMLRRIRRNFAPLLSGREWPPTWRKRHRMLLDEVERRAAEDPHDAVRFVQRLPYYAERLLAPIPPEDH